MDAIYQDAFDVVIHRICALDWRSLNGAEMTDVAWAYYFFSIQFRESLNAARAALPGDENLLQLEREECDTSNLSPYPGVAAAGEKMNHDEFMRRLLQLSPVSDERRRTLEQQGEAYLATTRSLEAAARAMSIASYEAGGLERVFKAILTASAWDSPLLQAFRHFLVEHIKFDSDPDGGHGALSQHLRPDSRITPLWTAFHDLLTGAVPALAR